MLTDKQIEDVAQPFIRECGDYSAYEEAIPYRDIEDFARAIEKAVLFDQDILRAYERIAELEAQLAYVIST